MIKDVVNYFFPNENVKVNVVKNYNNCSISHYISVNNGWIVNSEPTKITIGLNKKNTFDVFTIFNDEFKKVFSKYHPLVFSFLHEIGHSKTLNHVRYSVVVDSQKEIEDINIKLQNRDISLKEANVKYRKVAIEKMADDWALEYAKIHPKMCLIINEFIKTLA